MISGPRNRVSDRSSLAIQAPPKVADSQSTLTLTKVAQSDLEADRSRVSWRPHPFAKTRTLTLAVSAAFRAVDSRLFVFPYFLLWLSKAEGKEDGFFPRCAVFLAQNLRGFSLDDGRDRPAFHMIHNRLWKDEIAWCLPASRGD